VSPDLAVFIRSIALTRSRAKAIARSAWPAEALWVAGGGPSWWKKLTRRDAEVGWLNLGAHDILDEEADWDEPTWLFDPQQLPRFTLTLQRLYEPLPEAFTLLAAWGDPPTREERVSRDKLL
jgi:hypothetical protein